MFHWLGPARARIHTQTQHTPGDLGNACLGHVEVCAAVAQPESRSTSSSTSPLSAQGDQIPCTQPSHTKKPLRTPKWDVRTRNFRKNTTEKGGNGKEDCIPLREDFVSSFRDFGAFIFLFFLTPSYSLSVLWVSHWPPLAAVMMGALSPVGPGRCSAFALGLLVAVLVLVPFSGVYGQPCPTQCSCTGTTVDCHGQGLRSVPRNIPRNAERL